MGNDPQLSADWVGAVMRQRVLLVMIGGAIGTYGRYALGSWFSGYPWAQGFPYATMLINVSGSFVLGFAAVLIQERLPLEYQNWFLLVGTGLCGGFTTFSTFEWETFKLIRDGSWWAASMNVVGSVAAGFGGVLLGVILASSLFPKR